MSARNRRSHELSTAAASGGPANEPGSQAPEAPKPSAERTAALGSRIAALLVVLGAALMVLGSSFTWATFGGFLGLAWISGIRLGPGVVTLLIGALLGLIGLGALRSGGVTRFRRWAMILAVGGLAIVVLTYIVLALPIVELEYGEFMGLDYGDFFGLEYGRVMGPDEAVLLVALGAALAAIAASRLKSA